MLEQLMGKKRKGKYLSSRNNISNSGLVCLLNFDTFSSQFVNQLGLVTLKKGDKEGWVFERISYTLPLLSLLHPTPFERLPKWGES